QFHSGGMCLRSAMGWGLGTRSFGRALVQGIGGDVEGDDSWLSPGKAGANLE
ncbi:MAG: hypothetical protein RLZZ617_941, partial [Bacteroidota bacterium]